MKHGLPRAVRRALLASALLVSVAGAQGRRWGDRSFPSKDPDFKEFNVPYTGLLTFVRMRYTPTRLGWGGGGGFFGGVNYSWDHDYPRSDEHIMTMLQELTAIAVQRRGGNILSVNDPELFKFPVAYMCEPGFWTLTPEEAARFRAYVLKGGFVIVDDFAGGEAFWHFQEVLRQALPDARLIQLDASHPIFHTFFEIDTLDYVHPYYDVPSYFFGVFEDNDPTKRLMIIVNANNDISESWEWSDTGFIPIDITNRAYRLGVNYFIYALTH